MEPERPPSILFALGLALLFTLAFWFRVSSLGAFPEHDGDESYEGIAVARMLAGKSFTVYTTNGNLLDPFFVAMQVPFQLAFEPSLWVLRAPAAVSGLLAVLLTYVLGVRVIGRSAALTASAVLATLPAAVVFSRVGYEYCQIPLVGVVAIYFAFRARALGMTMSALAGLLVHPINVFLVPVVLSVYLAQRLRQHAGDPARQRSVLRRSALIGTAAVVALVCVMLRRPIVQGNLSLRPPLDWALFLKGLERLFLHQYGATPAPRLVLQHTLFRGVVATVLLLGVRRLVKDRRWDQLALIGGLAASLAAFHVLAGPRRLADPGTHRYGVVFVAPAVLAFACLVQAAFGGRADGVRAAARGAFVLATCSALLIAGKGNWFDAFTADGKESLWTLRADTVDPYEQALALIRREDARTRVVGDGATPCRIIAQQYWVSKPLEYLASWDGRLRVGQLVTLVDMFLYTHDLKGVMEPRRRQVVERLREGCFVVGRPDSPPEHGGRLVEDAVQSTFTEDEVSRWVIAGRDGVLFLVIYRLKGAGDRPAGLTAGRATKEGGLPTTRR